MSNSDQYPSVTHPQPTHTTIIYKHSNNTNQYDNFALAIGRLEKAVTKASININTAVNSEQSLFYKSLENAVNHSLKAASGGMNNFLNNSLPKINSMFSEYEKNIEVILTKIKNTDFVELSNQNGMGLAQQQLDAYKINDQLLVDQNRAFSDMNISLKQIIDKLDPPTVKAEMQATDNFAKAHGMEYKNVSNYRQLMNLAGVDKGHADASLLDIKKLYDIKGNKQDLLKNPMVQALVDGNNELLSQLQNTTNIDDFIALLMENVKKAHQNTTKNGNVGDKARKIVETLNTFFDNEDVSAAWRNPNVKFLSERDKIFYDSKEGQKKGQEDIVYTIRKNAAFEQQRYNESIQQDVNKTQQFSNLNHTSVVDAQGTLSLTAVELYEKAIQDWWESRKDDAKDNLKTLLQNNGRINTPLGGGDDNIGDLGHAAMAFGMSKDMVGTWSSWSNRQGADRLLENEKEYYKNKAGYDVDGKGSKTPKYGHDPVSLDTMQVNANRMRDELKSPKNQNMIEYLKTKGMFLVPNFEDGRFKLFNKDNRELRDIGPKLNDFVREIEKLRQAETEKGKKQETNNHIQEQQKQKAQELIQRKKEINKLGGQSTSKNVYIKPENNKTGLLSPIATSKPTSPVIVNTNKQEQQILDRGIGKISHQLQQLATQAKIINNNQRFYINLNGMDVHSMQGWLEHKLPSIVNNSSKVTATKTASNMSNDSINMNKSNF